jgi:hypothetical protein
MNRLLPQGYDVVGTLHHAISKNASSIAGEPNAADGQNVSTAATTCVPTGNVDQLTYWVGSNAAEGHMYGLRNGHEVYVGNVSMVFSRRLTNGHFLYTNRPCSSTRTSTSPASGRVMATPYRTGPGAGTRIIG